MRGKPTIAVALFVGLLCCTRLAIAAPSDSPSTTAASLLAALAPSAVDHSDSLPTLHLFTWENYMDPALLDKFTQQHQIQVREVHYETDDLKDEIMAHTQGIGLDLVIGSGISLKHYKKLNWITSLRHQQIPNQHHIDPRWSQLNPELDNIAVPFLWGTIGIAYRRDKIDKVIDSWSDLYQPGEPLRKRIMMLNDMRDTIGMGLKLLGYSVNHTDLQALKQVRQLLQTQKPFVHSYGYPGIDANSELVSGEIWMAPLYNGDALTLAQYHPDIVFVVPKEGTNLWIDYIAIVSASKQAERAAKFINFINQPEHAAQLANYLNYATPNLAAKQLLPNDQLNNPIIYPNDTLLSRSEIYQPLPAEVVRRRNDLFIDVTH